MGAARPGRQQELHQALERRRPEGKQGSDAPARCPRVVLGREQGAGRGGRTLERLIGRLPTGRARHWTPSCRPTPPRGPGPPRVTPGVCPRQAAQRGPGPAAPLRAEVGAARQRLLWVGEVAGARPPAAQVSPLQHPPRRRPAGSTARPGSAPWRRTCGSRCTKEPSSRPPNIASASIRCSGPRPPSSPVHAPLRPPPPQRPPTP